MALCGMTAPRWVNKTYGDNPRRVRGRALEELLECRASKKALASHKEVTLKRSLPARTERTRLLKLVSVRCQSRSKIRLFVFLDGRVGLRGNDNQH
jgi:hypothetical protein